MNRRRFITTAGAGVATGLAGCLGDDSTPAQMNTGGGGETGRDHIRVGAAGDAETEPDLAVATVGVEATADDADEVRDRLAPDADAILAALTDAGVDDDDITTGRFDIRERRQEPGYRGHHSYRIEIEEMDRVGELVDVAVDAGADDVSQVQFTLADETRETLREEALEDALANADREATVIADDRDVSIDGTLSVATEEVSYRSAGGSVALETAADDGGGTDLESGPVTVSARVTVTYATE